MTKDPTSACFCCNFNLRPLVPNLSKQSLRLYCIKGVCIPVSCTSSTASSVVTEVGDLAVVSILFAHLAIIRLLIIQPYYARHLKVYAYTS